MVPQSRDTVPLKVVCLHILPYHSKCRIWPYPLRLSHHPQILWRLLKLELKYFLTLFLHRKLTSLDFRS